jgi:hypothetical protein
MALHFTHPLSLGPPDRLGVFAAAAMSRLILRLLLPLIAILAMLAAQPSFGSAPEAPIEPVPASHLSTDFWLADTLDLRDELTRQGLPLADWIDQVNRSDVTFICLGESHTNAMRSFLADQLLPLLDIDVLMIEAEAAKAEQIVDPAAAQVTAREATTRLLGADIAAVMRSVRARNPQVQIVGVDETDQQKRWRNLEQVQSPQRRLSRDGFIAQNIAQAFQPHRRTVALFGANHCATHDLGLGNARPFFRHLAGVLAPRSQMKSLLLVPSAPLSPLSIALGRSNLPALPWVIPDNQAIRPESYNYRWDLTTPLTNFDALVYFPS